MTNLTCWLYFSNFNIWSREEKKKK